MAQIPKCQRKKLDSKSVEAILVGYGTNIKGFHLYSPQSQKYFYSRNVTFLDEELTGQGGLQASGESLNTFIKQNTVSLDLNTVSDTRKHVQTTDPTSNCATNSETDEQDDVIEEFVEALDEILLTDDDSDAVSQEVEPHFSSQQDDTGVRQSNRLRNKPQINYNEKVLSNKARDLDQYVMLSNFDGQPLHQESGTKIASSNSLRNGGRREVQGKSTKHLKEKFRSFLNSFVSHKKTKSYDSISNSVQNESQC